MLLKAGIKPQAKLVASICGLSPLAANGNDFTGGSMVLPVSKPQVSKRYGASRNKHGAATQAWQPGYFASENMSRS